MNTDNLRADPPLFSLVQSELDAVEAADLCPITITRSSMSLELEKCKGIANGVLETGLTNSIMVLLRHLSDELRLTEFSAPVVSFEEFFKDSLYLEYVDALVFFINEGLEYV